MRDIKDIAWLAGLIEGEGSFYLSPDAKQVAIYLRMTDEDVVVRAKLMFGIHTGVLVLTRGNSGRLRRNAMYGINVRGSAAVGWMLTLYSFLGARRRAKIRDIVSRWRSGKSVPRRGRGRQKTTLHDLLVTAQVEEAKEKRRDQQRWPLLST